MVVHGYVSWYVSNKGLGSFCARLEVGIELG